VIMYLVTCHFHQFKIVAINNRIQIKYKFSSFVMVEANGYCDPRTKSLSGWRILTEIFQKYMYMQSNFSNYLYAYLAILQATQAHGPNPKTQFIDVLRCEFQKLITKSCMLFISEIDYIIILLSLINILAIYAGSDTNQMLGATSPEQNVHILSTLACFQTANKKEIDSNSIKAPGHIHNNFHDVFLQNKLGGFHLNFINPTWQFEKNSGSEPPYYYLDITAQVISGFSDYSQIDTRSKLRSISITRFKHILHLCIDPLHL
ncbi:hypothetical protein ACJX0J_015591, partial [Zea mays]